MLQNVCKIQPMLVMIGSFTLKFVNYYYGLFGKKWIKKVPNTQNSTCMLQENLTPTALISDIQGEHRICERLRLML